MIDYLRRLCRAYLDSIPKPDQPTTLTDATIIREHFRPLPVPAETRQAYLAFVEIITRPLPESEVARLRRRAQARLKAGVECADAVARTFLGDAGQQKPNWVVIACDHKAVEEVAWQANLVAQTHGIREPWDLDWQQLRHHRARSAPDEEPAVSRSLQALASWLKPRGRVVLLMDLGGDEYTAIITTTADAATCQSLAPQLGFTIQTVPADER